MDERKVTEIKERWEEIIRTEDPVRETTKQAVADILWLMGGLLQAHAELKELKQIHKPKKEFKSLNYNPDPKYILLEGLEHGFRFIITNEGEDPRYLADGKQGFRIIGYAESVRAAQIKLYGKSYTDSME